MRSLDEARAYQKQEKSVDTYELWAAILATHDALVEMGGPGLPELHVNRARANLIRAGQGTCSPHMKSRYPPGSSGSLRSGRNNVRPPTVPGAQSACAWCCVVQM